MLERRVINITAAIFFILALALGPFSFNAQFLSERASPISFQTPQALAITDTIIAITGIASTTWTVPSDWNNASNTIEVIGAGGGGGGTCGTNVGCTGGGGGAYAKISNFTTSTGSSVRIQVGTGGAGSATGTISYFNWNNSGSTSTCSASTMQVCASGGAKGIITTGGAGGATSTSVGTTTYKGGNGQVGSGGTAGGGGGAAGRTGAGNGGNSTTGGQGDGSSGGTGGAAQGGTGNNGSEWGSYGSGGGGGGRTTDGNGGPGGNYGAGGGGARSSNTGGAGTNGIIIITYTPIPTAPGTPTYSGQSSSTPGSVTVNWTAGTNADYYNLHRATSSNGTYSFVASTSATNYGDTGLTANTSYWYKVQSVNNGSSSAFSATSTVLMYPDQVSPAPTYSGQSSSTPGNITINWSAPSTGATYYDVYYATSSNGTYNSVATTSNTSYADSGRSANTTYWYEIRAVNNTGGGLFSATSSVLTYPGQVTAAPTYSGQSSSTPGSVTVNWSAPTGGATYYNIHYATSSNGTYSFVASTTGTSYGDTGRAANTTYWYKVQAVNSTGAGLFSPTSSVLTYPNQVSPAPTYTSVNTSSLTANWTALANGATYYDLYYATSSNGTYGFVASTTGTNQATSGLSVNTPYWYKVRGVNTTGGGLFSSTSSIYTLANTPSAPTIGSPTTSTLTLTNNVNGNPSGTSYAVYISATSPTDNNWNGLWMDSTGNGTSSSPVWITDLSSKVVGNLKPATTYSFKVAAKNGDSATTSLSAAGSGTTNTAGLSAPTVTAISPSTSTNTSTAPITSITGTNFALGWDKENGLVGNWRLDETSGSSIADSSGNANNTTATGTAVIAGKIGNGRSFNGTSDYAAFSNTSALNIETVSVAVWINTTSSGATANIIEKWDDSAGRYPYVLRQFSSGTIQFAAYDGTNNPYPVSATTINNGNWHHVVGTRTKGGTMSLYIDGALSATTTDTTSGSTTSTVAIGVGARLSAPASGFFKGKLDEIRIYNRVLSATEVNELYLATQAPYVSLTKTGQSDIVASSTNAFTLSSSTALASGVFNIVGAATGTWNVVVTNPDGQTGTLTNGFTISTGTLSTGYITFDATSTWKRVIGGTTLSWSHTIGSSDNRLLIVGASSDYWPPLTVSSISYGGQSLTQLQRLRTAGSYGFVELWYLIAPNTGTATVTITMSGATDVSASSLSLFGVDQTTPIEATGTATGANGSPSSTVTTVTNNAWIIEIACGGVNDLQATVSPGILAAKNTQYSSPPYGLQYKTDVSPAGSYLQAWSSWNPGCAQWASISAAIKPAPASGVDTTPPSPDPMTWSTNPYALSTSSIRMIATTANDTTTPPVIYLFTYSSSCTADNGTGGASSSWQSSTTYTNSGLQVNKCYSYRVKAGDSVTSTNATANAATSSAYTLAATPGAPTLSSSTESTLKLNINENGNPSNTLFAVQVTSTSPTDNNWSGKWVDSNGASSTVAVWLTKVQLTDLVVTGLQPSTGYTFTVKAQNGDSLQTAQGATGVGTTTAITPPGIAGTPTYSITGSTGITLNWTASSNASATYYGIERSTDGVSFSQISTTTSLSYGDTGLTANSTYYYRARGNNAGGWGSYSASSSIGTAASCVSDNQNATIVLGQSSFTTNATGTSQSAVNYTSDAAYDPTNQRLFVVDNGNNRILVYSVGASGVVNGKNADYVLGQANFASAVATATQSGFNNVYSAAHDAVHQRLFVADNNNSRVLVFDVATSTIANGMNASYVLGASNFTTTNATSGQNGMYSPQRVAYDPVNDRLFVSDWTNRRVLVFNVASGTIANGMNASYVLGQTDFNAAVSTTTQNGMIVGGALAYDASSTRLFVGDWNSYRVLVFNVATNTISNGMNASYVLGQTDFTSAVNATNQSKMPQPISLAYDSNSKYLFAAASPGNRVLVFNVATNTIANGMNASYVLGQPDFLSTGAHLNQKGFTNFEGMGYDPTNQRLFVADAGGNRVLGFNTQKCGNYLASGYLDSTTFDTGVASGTILNSVLWQGTLPAGTTVGFQFAVSNSSSGPWTYYGLNGDGSSYFTGNPGTPIKLKTTTTGYSLFNGYRYFRYRVTLFSDSPLRQYTPNINQITVNWSP